MFTFHRWRANLRILGVEEIKSIPYLPISHPFIERLIGTIRRKYLNHFLFWNASDLERKLQEFRNYYNGHRVHASLGGQTPEQMNGDQLLPPTSLDRLAWRSHCRGLFQTPVRRDLKFARHRVFFYIEPVPFNIIQLSRWG